MILSILSVSGCFGEKNQTTTTKGDITKEDIVAFEKKRISLGTSLDVRNISLFLEQKLQIDGWTAYVLSLELKQDENEFETKDILFSDGKVIATELFDHKTSRSFKDSIEVTVPKELYKDDHLIAGNKDAKHKVVLFSDPLCPFCIEYVPEIITYAKNNPKLISLYYYHFPLTNIHPASITLAQAMIKLKEENKIKDLETKTYQAKFENSFDPRETDPQKIIEAFNKAVGSNLTTKDIDTKEIQDEIKKDMQIASDALVSGTPTIFIDGKLDKTRDLYKKLK
ncbi:MAG: hypothetical protein B1H07_04960 [Campylobacteraceae bacterium 4484_166]|nr:MAG: hypothetical protein B1H07_04960 [Campylobacteraceae bacterium 4484_166]